MTPAPRRAEDLSTVTSRERDRYIDLLRGLSILVVVFGHWTMAAFTPAPEGTVRVENVMSYATALQPVTWLAQVMPLFFVAAGFTNALALRNPGRTVWSFFAGRVQRVTRPALVFIAIWLLVAVLLPHTGVPEDLVRVAGQNSAMVLWFLAVYLFLVALAPVQRWLYQRSGWALVILALPVVAGLDQLQGTTVAGFGFLNYLVIFAFCQQLGFLYADSRLQAIPGRVWAGIAALALAALLLLTGPGPYPVSMIDLPGQEMSNMLPPSLAVIAVATLQVSLAMTLRPRLVPMLQRPRIWLAVAVVNRSIMTIFLWHLTAIVMVTGAVLALDIGLPEPATASWWWHKALWLAACSVLTAGIVAALTPIEARTPAGSGAGRGAPGVSSRGGWGVAGLASSLGIVAVALGMAMLAAAGFADPFRTGGLDLAGLTFAPAWGVAAVVAGYLLCRAVRDTTPRR